MDFDPKKNLHLGAVVGLKLADAKEAVYLGSEGFISCNMFAYRTANPFLNFSCCLFRLCAALPYKSEKKVRQVIEQGAESAVSINTLT
jgi:hypothetical protein